MAELGRALVLAALGWSGVGSVIVFSSGSALSFQFVIVFMIVVGIVFIIVSAFAS